MRTVVDHHVDRPEMHAQQCAQLTGTNRPIGLIRSSDGTAAPGESTTWENRVFTRFGGHSASKTPDPIPNSAVKCRRADGTASQDVGE